MEKATIAGGFFKLLALWGHASSGHTKTLELGIATARLKILTPRRTGIGII
jgi:hypothetical protein